MKSAFLIAHVLSVICGVGGALLMDIYLLRHLRGNVITVQDVAFTSFVAVFVKLGLVAVWASGIAILSIAPDGPVSVLANPKVQAKLIVVVVLTLNALFIETMALPLIHRNVGGCLFDGVKDTSKGMILACGAVSTISWLTPLVLGLTRELNDVVPAHHILIGYGWLLGCAVLASQFGGHFLYRPAGKDQSVQAAPQPEKISSAPKPLSFHAAVHETLEQAYAVRPSQRASRAA